MPEDTSETGNILQQMEERIKTLEKRVFIENAEGRRIEPKRNLFTDFPELKGEKFYLKKWIGTKISVFISGRKNAQTFHSSYFKI